MDVDESDSQARSTSPAHTIHHVLYVYIYHILCIIYHIPHTIFLLELQRRLEAEDGLPGLRHDGLVGAGHWSPGSPNLRPATNPKHLCHGSLCNEISQLEPGPTCGIPSRSGSFHLQSRFVWLISAKCPQFRARSLKRTSPSMALVPCSP